jgi:hypothetical protein
MKISTKAQYELLTSALCNAGYTVDTVYDAVEAGGFSVDLGDVVYEGIYVSRILAIMHKANEAKATGGSDVAPLKLKLKRARKV